MKKLLLILLMSIMSFSFTYSQTKTYTIATNWELSKIGEFVLSWATTTSDIFAGLKTYTIPYINACADSTVIVIEGADNCKIFAAGIAVTYGTKTVISPGDTVIGSLTYTTTGTLLAAGYYKDTTGNRCYIPFAAGPEKRCYIELVMKFFPGINKAVAYSPRIYVWMWKKGS
jgi:hypothetical protein